MIKVKKILTEETYTIRFEVLRKDIPLPYKFNGDFEKETFHLGAFKNNQLIAVSSFMKVSNNNFYGDQFQLRGMATLESFQGLGAGKLMVDKAIEILKTQKIDYLWCNARVIAVDFYKKQGFKIAGELFDIKYVGSHYLMFNELK
ncbi:Ribosomal protein S18 acetylase RimI [Lutibacter agarilyticus]|uniref:Ribosomal protein S18 acetylase RimI n=1 Tax=Lutibacter agarilyticus TaxID=1109740 RepID=A0A238YSG6_9FLAO|nr:GNAT family N-acetyltransferase [Lutibacter agarilyticus]SNR73614.1 Ribosomal protein S18 acetylase RimI [Lutibacter agarilyticus]